MSRSALVSLAFAALLAVGSPAVAAPLGQADRIVIQSTDQMVTGDSPTRNPHGSTYNADLPVEIDFGWLRWLLQSLGIQV